MLNMQMFNKSFIKMLYHILIGVILGSITTALLTITW